MTVIDDDAAAEKMAKVTTAALAEIGYADPDELLTTMETPPPVMLKALNLGRMAIGMEPFDTPEEMVGFAISQFSIGGDFSGTMQWMKYAQRWNLDWRQFDTFDMGGVQ